MLYTNGFGISLLADAALKLNCAEKTDYKKEFKIYKKEFVFLLMWSSYLENVVRAACC